jgi:ABC-type bacteriocin/lantibiotic exporter with double-glycine peptidase domain
LLRNSLDLLTEKEKWRLSILLAGLLVVGLLQIVGVGSILPLLSVIADPEQIREQVVVEFVSKYIEFSDTNSIVIFLAGISLALIVISNVLSAITAYLSVRFVWSIQSRLSTELLTRYLSHPYEILLGMNPAEAEKNVIKEVEMFTGGVLRPFLRLLTSTVVAMLIVGFLIWFNPVMAGITVVLLGGGYVVTFVLVRRSLTTAGERRADSNEARFKTASEAIAGVKEIQILGREQEFTNRFQTPSQYYARATTLHSIISDIPRYMIEVLAFGSLLIVALYVAVTSGDLKDIAPIISVYALAGYRLIPAMQRIYSDWSSLRFWGVIIPELHKVYVDGQEHRQRSLVGDDEKLELQSSIEISNLDYRYPDTSTQVIAGMNLTIDRGQTVSFIGETGSGKTTLMELLIGVLRPSSGAISVNGIPLVDGNMRSWQRSMGYVPQDIFLIDDSVQANIAFGVPQSEIDIEAVRNAARIANIDHFVMDEMPDQYDSIVGARGVRLSGGQRQRIGIARAMYHKPTVLFLDEATSNLDQETEHLLHETLERVSKDLTVIIIAHRLKTTRSSDVIYVLEYGKVVGKGKYDDLVNADGNLRAEYSSQRPR